MISALKIVGLAAAVCVAGFATQAAAAGSTVTLRACNHTDDTVLIAASFVPVGGSDLRNTGWTRVRAGGCADILQTASTTFYARAEVKDDSNRYWGSNVRHCVEYPGPYDFHTALGQTTCPKGEPVAFITFHSDGRPVYVWNMTPPS